MRLDLENYNLFLFYCPIVPKLVLIYIVYNYSFYYYYYYYILYINLLQTTTIDLEKIIMKKIYIYLCLASN